MTQASLSPDLDGVLSAPISVRANDRSAAPSEPALWMVVITSSALVVASVLLLALISQSVVADASLGGFVSGIGVVIAAVGIGGVSYALLTARRAGYLDFAPTSAAAPSVAPAGMHVVPAVPADLGRRKRQQLEAERAVRNRQAKAIAAAAATTLSEPRTPAPPRQAPRSTAPPRAVPRTHRAAVARTAAAGTGRPVPAQPAPVRTAPPAPASSRAAPAQTRPVVAAPPSRRQAPAITMPRPQLRQPRPAAWPNRAPVVRLTPPTMHPRTQVALFQVHTADVRAATPLRPR